MTEYREIQGAAVQSLASSTGTIEGQIWYDNVNGVFKLESVTTVGAWSSGGNMPDSKTAMGAGGPKTAAIQAGGEYPYKSSSANYDGSTWTSNPSLNTARGGLGSSKDGSQTAFLVFGGAPGNLTASENFNGSAWTATPSLNTGKESTSGAGTSTAALNAGRWGPPLIGNTEEYDGTSWSEQNDLTTARGEMACFGSQTAAIFAGGNSGSPPNYRNLAEEYNGTSWTAVATLNTARGMGGSGGGSSTSGLVFGGNTPGPTASNASESWDGTSWVATPNLSAAGVRSGTGSSSGSALAMGNYPYAATVEEFTGAGVPETQTITVT
jgi:hypothetical protein